MTDSHNPRGFVGIGAYHPKDINNVGSIVRSAGCFGASYVCTIGGQPYERCPTDLGHNRHVPVFQFDSWEIMKNSIPQNSEIVLIDYDESAYNINDFTHPERGLYLVGNEGYGFPEEILDEGYRKVYIESDFCLNAAMAATLVLRERYRVDRE